jgi:inhibitor of cysteine peptidase
VPKEQTVRLVPPRRQATLARHGSPQTQEFGATLHSPLALSPSSTEAVADIEIRESGTSVTVSPGDRIVIRVPETPSTGYQWAPETIPDALELISSEFEPPTQLRPGAAGERTIHLSATKPGRGETIFRLVRGWQTDAPLAQLTVNVTVT